MANKKDKTKKFLVIQGGKVNSNEIEIINKKLKIQRINQVNESLRKFLEQDYQDITRDLENENWFS